MRQKRVAILSFTAVTEEPRVLKQVFTLTSQMAQVVLLGFKGEEMPPDGVETQYLPPPSYSSLQRLQGLFLKILNRLFKNKVSTLFWYHPYHRRIWKIVERTKADFFIGHDYIAAPFVARLAEKNQVPYSIDCHEHALSQFNQDWKWRLLTKPVVKAIQQQWYPKAAIITAVCKGIADLIHEEHQLKNPPLVIQNMAIAKAMPFRPVASGSIKVLYHGLLIPFRGIEELVESVVFWDSDYRLILRGQGQASYLESIEKLAKKFQIADRIQIEAKVPYNQVVAAAHTADIGFFAQPKVSNQKKFTLPNKFFEYIQAGLALCIGDLPEMRTLLETYDIGVVIESYSPAGIAQIINSLTREHINYYKQQSVIAATALSWEHESQKLAQSYVSILGV